MAKVLMTGNAAIGEAAIRAGCQSYFGYPITPQNELTEYMAAHLSRRPGCSFVQAESEIAAINMVYGASVAGVRAMTSSSSPGISLKQEGISYLAACQLPAVIVNMSRGGPGLGSISASQSDYFQSTRGGGHGDYRTIVLGPASVQELADLTHHAFELTDKYFIPVIILGDGMLGQMMEPLEFKHEAPDVPPVRQDALRGAKGRPSKFVRTFTSHPPDLEEVNWSLFRRYQLLQKQEVMWENYMTEDARLIVTAFGIAARIAKGAIKQARAMGLKIGMFRPITLWPFPSEQLKELAKTTKYFLDFEMNMGQMIEDVRLSLEGQGDISFHGRPGGVIPTPSEVLRIITRIYHQKGLN
ncbi:MAG TPA: 3-methyl-2-oxobutanoate dehydrogenase subunit VorB [Spirochaetota bacterium]|mgnify:CR=1 FL=1|nr:3-methyl-2-oxobutanoate dehydrogenase subunit VorB [Spirochaetota bacterium]HPI91243.1 3-methyl-2-oxobutanoate dehydrogenase subunit VorB [Spirochaetota bacterium]HPR49900.1 3-methyl-2-oxobutanoate dehydrogenase subunit VorB [Spirochaetota bacterium]